MPFRNSPGFLIIPSLQWFLKIIWSTSGSSKKINDLTHWTWAWQRNHILINCFPLIPVFIYDQVFGQLLPKHCIQKFDFLVSLKFSLCTITKTISDMFRYMRNQCEKKKKTQTEDQEWRVYLRAICCHFLISPDPSYGSLRIGGPHIDALNDFVYPIINVSETKENKVEFTHRGEHLSFHRIRLSSFLKISNTLTKHSVWNRWKNVLQTGPLHPWNKRSKNTCKTVIFHLRIFRLQGGHNLVDTFGRFRWIHWHPGRERSQGNLKVHDWSGNWIWEPFAELNKGCLSIQSKS